MSLTTFFQFTQTSYLPLPTPRQIQSPSSSPPTSTLTTKPLPRPPNPETSNDILNRGYATALSMLHSPELMIALNPLVQHYTRIHPTDPSQSHQQVDLPRLASDFNVVLHPTSPSCHTFADSTNGEFVHYEIIDKFNMLFGSVSKLLTYKACFRPLYPIDSTALTPPSTSAGEPDPRTQAQPRSSIGLETISDPGNGVSLLGKWTLSTDDTRPGFIVLTESVKVHCNFMLGWYVRSQLETSHVALHKEFGARFCQRMIEGDPLRGRDYRGGRSWGEVKRGLSVLERTESEGGMGSQKDVGMGGGRQLEAQLSRDGAEGNGGGRVDQYRQEQRQKLADWEAERDKVRERERERERETEREEVVSAVGDDVSGINVSVPSGPNSTRLVRTRTNDSDVSSMR